MNWCNCDHDQNYNISDINNGYHDGHSVCFSCGNSINNDDMIILLVKEVKRLSLYVEDLEFEKMERERIKIEEEVVELNELKKIAAESERFNILDL